MMKDKTTIISSILGMLWVNALNRDGISYYKQELYLKECFLLSKDVQAFVSISNSLPRTIFLHLRLVLNESDSVSNLILKVKSLSKPIVFTPLSIPVMRNGQFIWRFLARLSIEKDIAPLLSSNTVSLLFNDNQTRNASVKAKADVVTFLIATFGFEDLPKTIQDEAHRIESEKKEKEYKEYLKLEEIRKKVLEEKAEADRREREREEQRNKIIRDQETAKINYAKELIKAVWNEYNLRKDVDDLHKKFFYIRYEKGTYVLFGYEHTPVFGESWYNTILELGDNRKYILSQLEFIKNRGLLTYQCAENYIDYNPQNIDLHLQSADWGAGPCYIGSLSLEQVYNVIEGQALYAVYKKSQENNRPGDKTTGSNQPTIQRTSSSSSGCYIATCVYGSYDCPEVWTLRRFRDQTLKNTKLGRAFIKVYYATSPTIVKWFGNTFWFHLMWKKGLDKLVCKLRETGYGATPYTDK